jgi:hypothetical protein
MKIRNGFVSNSSSSSFILALDKKPETVEELQEMLLKGDEFLQHPYEDIRYSARQVAEQVFKDLSEETPLTEEQVVDEFGRGYIPGVDAFELARQIKREFASEKRDEYDWDLIREIREKEAQKAAENFKKQTPEKQYFKVEYSDNDGDFHCALEHGNAFRRIPHFVISHH